MTDNLDPHLTPVPRDDNADRAWPGPLGNGYLTGTQRERLAEDLVLLSEALLRADDHSAYASLLREAATDIRDHREADHRRPRPASRSPQPDRDNPAMASRKANSPVPRAIAALARHEWQRWIGMASTDRITLLADRVWESGYRASFGAGYTTAACRVVAAATEAAIDNPRARATLSHLVTAGVNAITALAADQPLPPPADNRTLAAAQAAAAARGSAAWSPIAEVAWAGARTAGTLAGTLTAATDMLIGWRTHGGEASAEGVGIAGKPVSGWVADLLASINRDAARSIVASRLVAPTAAQLARQEWAPDVPATAVPLDKANARPPRAALPAATTNRRTR